MLVKSIIKIGEKNIEIKEKRTVIAKLSSKSPFINFTNDGAVIATGIDIAINIPVAR